MFENGFLDSVLEFVVVMAILTIAKDVGLWLWDSATIHLATTVEPSADALHIVPVDIDAQVEAVPLDVPVAPRRPLRPSQAAHRAKRKLARAHLQRDAS